ncbi:peptide deformylase [Mycolicibacterium goodii]|uniref:Peptide deformylase n=1 Tax=Mycolicibacterium goodii TaxID=134601 RepID=A0ABS6HVB3_MYCGD|nr:peptide deformylase [Mycolicibacterium goodii]MBU8836382.1 peptide deformylase [Mycolicibacterium goodii]
MLEQDHIPDCPPDDTGDIEGCLSVPGLMFPVPRAEWARVRGFDVHGQPIVIEGTGLFARMLQHEVAYLDGRLYVDQLVEPEMRCATWTPGVDRHPFRP